MRVPHSGLQYAHPLSSMEPGGCFRLAASACVVMPIAAQAIAVIAIIRVTVMLSPIVCALNGLFLASAIPTIRAQCLDSTAPCARVVNPQGSIAQERYCSLEPQDGIPEMTHHLHLTSVIPNIG